MRDLVKGKRWLLLSRWANLTAGKRLQLNELFAPKACAWAGCLRHGPHLDLTESIAAKSGRPSS